MRKLEALFAFLIAVMALSFAWMFGDTKPSGVELLLGEKIQLGEINLSFNFII